MDTQALTKQQRNAIASRVSNAMQAAYEADGEEGDFEGAQWYLANDASDQELLAEELRWCNKA